VRYIIALPDYSQSGSISAWTEKGIMPLKKALSEVGVDLSSLPPSFVIGIPEPVLKVHGGNGFVLSQVVRLDNCIVISTSCQAGLDKSGRHVFLTELTVEENVETGSINLNSDYKFRPVGAGKEISDLVKEMREIAFDEINNLLMISSRFSRYKHLSSSQMIGMRYQPDWPKKKVINWLPSGGNYAIMLMALLLMGIVIYAYLAKSR